MIRYVGPIIQLFSIRRQVHLVERRDFPVAFLTANYECEQIVENRYTVA